MFKNLVMAAALISMAVGAAANARQVSMEVRDLKSGKVETRISVPLWLAKVGAVFANAVKGEKEKVDFVSVISSLEKQNETGPFLVIEDHEENERVAFVLE